MIQTAIIVGNALSLCAMVSDAISGTRKKRNQILAVQTVSQFFYGASSIALKGFSSTAQNVVAVFRNIAAIKNVKSKAAEWILIFAGVALGAVFNNRGLLGWLPIVANLEYSVAVFKLKNNEKTLKAAFIVNSIMYAVFNAMIKNFVGVLSCAIVAVTTAVSLIASVKKREQTEEPEAEENS